MPNLDYGVTANEYDYYFIGRPDLNSDFLAQRSAEWSNGNVHACDYNCGEGTMGWTNWNGKGEDEDAVWEGMESCQSGDTIGMLLNLGECTLTAYRNNRRLGVIKDGLSGSYCWHVSVLVGVAVTIKRGEPPMA